MNDKLKNYISLLKKPSSLIFLGAVGIGLVLLSSFFSADKGKNGTALSQGGAYDAEEYRISAEESIRKIVTGISGDSEPTVVITLESSVRYSYVETIQSDSANASGKETEESRESRSQSYITVKTSDGGEKPLVITELMPEIRGVAVICAGGDNSEIAKKIEDAVTAALDITSKRVYISGGRIYEEG